MAFPHHECEIWGGSVKTRRPEKVLGRRSGVRFCGNVKLKSDIPTGSSSAVVRAFWKRGVGHKVISKDVRSRIEAAVRDQVGDFAVVFDEAAPSGVIKFVLKTPAPLRTQMGNSVELYAEELNAWSEDDLRERVAALFQAFARPKKMS